MIGFQVVERLETMHKHNFLHRDIKPENILIGIEAEYGVIYMVDFGLCKQYYNNKTKKHIQMIDQKGLIGTARYVSISTHKGLEQSRRDDLESLAYLLIYFAKGSLPWQNLAIANKQKKFEKIMQLKMTKSAKVLCKGLPAEFQLFLEETKRLEFEEEPNYDYLKELLLSVINNLSKKTGNTYFDWEIKFVIDKFAPPYNYIKSSKKISNDSNSECNIQNASEYSQKFESYPPQLPKQLFNDINVQEYESDSAVLSMDRTNDDQIHSVKVFESHNDFEDAKKYVEKEIE